MFLFWRTYVACRFLIHATLFSCVTCTEREASTNGPLTQETSARYIWDDRVTLPALDRDLNTMSRSSTFRIRRQKGLDLVERFWLNDEEWFQLSPRNFVVFFVSCIVLSFSSGSALNLDGIFASIGSHVSKNVAFYVTMAFTLVSTGHISVGDSPELMFVPLKHYLPDWKPTARALIATMLVHFYLVFVAFQVHFSFMTPLACTIVAPLLLAGISKPSDSIGQGFHEPGVKAQTVELDSGDPSTSLTKAWTIDSTLVYSSSRIRCLDLRVLLFGLSVTLVDVLCHQYQDEMFIMRWPLSAIISISVTAVWLYLENTVPTSRDIEPGLLAIAAAALVGVFSHVNFLGAFGLDQEEWVDLFVDDEMPKPENSSHSIMLALWYTTLVCMLVVNRRLVQQNGDQLLPTANGQPPHRDYLLFGFHVKTSRINFAWQLRQSRVLISIVFLMLASWIGESWPLEMDTTVAGLLLFTLTVGFQLRPRSDYAEEKISLHHVGAFVFSALIAILAIGLNRHSMLDAVVSEPKRDWKAGTWSISVFYQFLSTMIVQLEGRRWFTRRDRAEKSPTGDLRDEEKATVQEGEKNKVIDATSNG